MKNPLFGTLRRTAIAAALPFCACNLAWATDATTTLGISATVLSTCSVTATPIAFGNYALVTADATGTLSVTCTPNVTSYTIALDAGTGAGASTSARKMTGAVLGSTLNYALFRDAGRTQNWGNATGTDTLAGTAPVTSYTVYGRLAGNQTGAALGAYADTVTVTLSY